MQTDEFTVKKYPSLAVTASGKDGKKIRVCIATEEIIGPVRNGGIASTYYHLARGLAARGHEVHVLYLKGRKVENKTPEHWIEHFASFGIVLHYLELDEKPIWGPAVAWQNRYASAYRWLREQQPFDVVHTSEWRGGLIYVLMAKRLGLAFQDTIFIVKTSSPHIWNRHYQMQPIQKEDLIAASYAEQKCVELADFVVGGSAHLLTFMEYIGYQMPRKNVIVQPNIVDFSEVKVTDRRPPRKVNDIVKSREVTFFGRLETRKGLEIFCNALDILTDRGVTPTKVNLLGKFGDVLLKQGNISMRDYLNKRAKAWPFSIELITDKNQPEALSFLCSREMIAVMPSLIENSTMAVYEALENKLAFIATSVGGTPELIDEAYHDQVLVEPTSSSIADRLEHILKNGQVIPGASFSNAENLETWFGFHAYIATSISEKGREQTAAELVGTGAADIKQIDSLALVCLVRKKADVEKFVKALIGDKPDEVVLIVTDASLVKTVQTACDKLRKGKINVTLLIAIGVAAGTALNQAVEATTATGLVICDGMSVRPVKGFWNAVRTGLAMQPDNLMTTFYTVGDNTIGMPIGGDVTSQFLNSRAYGPELVAMTGTLQKRLGPFELYDVQNGLIHEFVTRAVQAGKSDLLVFSEPLLVSPTAYADHERRIKDPVYKYLKAKPLLDESSLVVRKILLSTLSGGATAIDPAKFRERARPDDIDAWLVHADKNRFTTKKLRNSKVVIGLDEQRSVLLFLAIGPGERTMVVNNSEIQTRRIETFYQDSNKEVTLDEWAIPAEWTDGGQYGTKLHLTNDKDIKTRFVRIMKLAPNVYSVISGSAIPSRDVIDQLLSAKKQSGITDRFSGLRKLLSGDELPEANTSFLNQALKEVGTEAPENNNRTDAKVSLTELANINWDKPVGSLKSTRAATREKSAGDFVDSNVIEGWAWDNQQQDSVLTVVVLADGVPVASVKADHFEESLGCRTPGLEQHGFRVTVPIKIIQNSCRIELRVLETRQLVKKGIFNTHADMLIPSLEVVPTVSGSLRARVGKKFQKWFNR